LPTLVEEVLTRCCQYQFVATDEGKINSCYWTNSTSMGPIEGDLDDLQDAPQTVSTNDKATSILYYGWRGDEEALPGFNYIDAQPFDSVSGKISDAEQVLLGHWGGEYIANSSTTCLVSHNITSYDVQHGKFEGIGTASFGDFHIAGQIAGDEITFTEKFLSPTNLIMSFQGHFHDDKEKIIGKCQWIFQSDAAENNLEGTFVLEHRPMSFFLFRPSEDSFKANRNRALWHWAYDSVLAQVRTRRLRWVALCARRDRRRREIKLENTLFRLQVLSPEDQSEYRELRATSHPADLRFWSALVLFQRPREVVHRHVAP
jgi:hypothetical protein